MADFKPLDTTGFEPFQPKSDPSNPPIRQKLNIEGFEPYNPTSVAGHAVEVWKGIYRESVPTVLGSAAKGAGIAQSMVMSEVQDRARQRLDEMIATDDPKRRALNAWRLRKMADLGEFGNKADEVRKIVDQLEKTSDLPDETLRSYQNTIMEATQPTKTSERVAYKIGDEASKWWREQFKQSPGYEESISGDIGGAIGSMAGFAIVSAATGPVGTFLSSGLMGVEEQYTRGIKAGLSEDEALSHAIAGAPAGIIDAMSMEFILRKVPPAFRNKFLQKTKDIAESATAEAMSETFSTIIQNAEESKYNPERGIFDGTAYEAALAGGTAAVFRAAILGAAGAKGKGPRQVPEGLTEAPGAQAEPLAESPAEAAMNGEIKDTSKPVTVTLEDGRKFQGYQQKVMGDGKRRIQARDGESWVLGDDEASIKDGWEDVAAPEGKVDEAKTTVDPLTQDDRDSPIPDRLIREGKQQIAEATGTVDANQILSDANIPPVGSTIRLKFNDGSVQNAQVQDAFEGGAKVLLDDGRVISEKFDDLRSKIIPLPLNVKGFEDVEPTKPEGEAQDETLPAIRREEGRGLGREGEPGPAAEPDRGTAPATGAIGTATGGGRDEAGGTTREGEVSEEVAPTPYTITGGTKGPWSVEVNGITYRGDQGRPFSSLDQAEDFARQKVTKSVGVAIRKRERPDRPVVEAEPVVAEPAPVNEYDVPEASDWWNSLSDDNKGDVLRKTGYGEGRNLRFLTDQGKQYKSASWQQLPELTRNLIVKEYADRIPRADRTPEAVPEEAPMEETAAPSLSESEQVQTQEQVSEVQSPEVIAEPVAVPAQKLRKPRAKDIVVPPEQVINDEARANRTRLEIPDSVYVKNNGMPFATANTSMLAARVSRPDLKKGQTEAVKVNGGWGWRVIGKTQQDVNKIVEKADVVGWGEVDTSTEDIVWTPELVKKQAKVAVDLRNFLDKVGLRDVASSADLQVFVGGKPVSGKFAIIPDTNNGIRAIIQASITLGKPGTIRHESIHALRNLGLFTDREWKTLEDSVSSNKDLMEEIDRRYPNLNREGKLEEGVAETFARYQTTQKGFARKAFDKIRDFIRSLGNALRGNGFNTVDKVFAGIESGRIGARERKPITDRQLKAFAQQVEDVAEDFNIKMDDKYAGLNFKPVEGTPFVKDAGRFLKTFVYPRSIAAFHQAFTPVYNVAKQQFSARNFIISKLVEIYTPYRRLNSKLKKDVNAVLELGRLYGETFEPDGNGEITVTADRNTGFMGAGETITLNKEQVKAYQSVRHAMDKALDLFAQQVVVEFGYNPIEIRSSKDALNRIKSDTKPSERAKLQKLARLLTDIKQATRTGYVPFSRWGNIVVTAIKHGEPGQDPITGKATKRQTLHSQVFEIEGLGGLAQRLAARGDVNKIAPIKKLLEELKKKYPDADVKAFQVAKKTAQPDQNRDLLSELFELPPDQLADAITNLKSEQLEKGFRRHFLGSANVPGYSLDFDRAIADYVMGIGGHIARRSLNRAWDQAIEGIPKLQPKLRDYAIKYRNYVNNPAEEFGTLRQFGFFSFLAGNISTGILNLTQVPMVTMPYLTMFNDPARIGVEFTRASKDTLKMLSVIRKKSELFDPEKAPEDVRDDLMQAWGEGEFTPMVTFDLAGVAYNRRATLRKWKKGWDNLVSFLGFTQSASERLNRVSTFIAAHRMASRDLEGMRRRAWEVLGDNALARDTLLSDFTPLNFARWVIDETHFEPGKHNRPELMRNAGAALFQFKSFQMNSMELQYRLATMHGKRGKVAFGLMLAGLMSGGGLFAATLAEDAKDLFELIYKWWTGLDLDVKTEVREMFEELTGSPFAAELMTNGSTRIMEVDLQHRIGMGQFFPRSFEDAAGIPFALTADKAVKFGALMNQGRPVDAFIEVMPVFAKNAMTSLKWHESGIRTQSGDLVVPPENVTAWDSLGKFVGFTPASLAEEREKEWAKKRVNTAVSDLRNRYYKSVAKAIAESGKAEERGDVKAFEKWDNELNDLMDEIDKHNENAPTHMLIILDDRTLRDRVASEYMGMGAIRNMRAPKIARERRYEIEGIYGNEEAE